MKKIIKIVEHAEELVIDAFKAGEYPQGTFTVKELNEIQSTYNPQKFEAPILIGHVSAYKGDTKIPAYGWVGSVKVVGDHLKLVASEFSQQLKDLIKGGFYKKVSAAFFQPNDPNNPTPGKWHLHHLAFLGAIPPAVKGLEQIAFAEVGNFGDGVVFAEMDIATVIDQAEKLGTEDTIKDMTEAVATFMAKVEDTLKSDVDEATKQNRIDLAKTDLSNELCTISDMHFGLTRKLEGMEEHTEKEEYSEQKNRIIELAQSIINKFTKGKEENPVDAKLQKQLEDENTALKAKVAEFAEAQRLADEAKVKADNDAKEALVKTEVTAFCEQAIRDGKMTPAMREKDEPIMLSLAKTSPDALVSFREKYSAPVVPIGEFAEAGKDLPKKNERPAIFVQADQYIKEHPSEFAGLTPELSLSRALYLHSQGKAEFKPVVETK